MNNYDKKKEKRKKLKQQQQQQQQQQKKKKKKKKKKRKKKKKKRKEKEKKKIHKTSDICPPKLLSVIIHIFCAEMKRQFSTHSSSTELNEKKSASFQAFSVTFEVCFPQ